MHRQKIYLGFSRECSTSGGGAGSSASSGSAGSGQIPTTPDPSKVNDNKTPTPQKNVTSEQPKPTVDDKNKQKQQEPGQQVKDALGASKTPENDGYDINNKRVTFPELYQMLDKLGIQEPYRSQVLEMLKQRPKIYASDQGVVAPYDANVDLLQRLLGGFWMNTGGIDGRWGDKTRASIVAIDNNMGTGYEGGLSDQTWVKGIVGFLVKYCSTDLNGQKALREDLDYNWNNEYNRLQALEAPKKESKQAEGQTTDQAGSYEIQGGSVGGEIPAESFLPSGLYDPSTDSNYSPEMQLILIQESNEWFEAKTDEERTKILKGIISFKEFLNSGTGRSVDSFYKSGVYEGIEKFNETVTEVAMATMGHDIFPVEPVMAEKAVAEKIKTLNKSRMIYLEINLQRFAERGIGGKGWRGDAIWRNAISMVKDGGTIRKIAGTIPTRQEAIDLIKESGGKVLRIEEPHAPPNPHNFTHINYQTPGGGKGTIEIIKGS